MSKTPLPRRADGAVLRPAAPAMLVSRPAGADELMKWERIPLQIP